MLSRLKVLIGLTVLLFPLTGCLLRSHKVERRVYAVPLQQATLSELVDKINAASARVQTLNATVDIATSVGGAKKGKVTEYQEIRGYVLIRKPSMLRMIGLFPVVRNRAFDMVSDGDRFRLSLPTKNRFIIGSKDVGHPSNQPLENLRPQHISEALLIQPVDPQTEITVLESDTEMFRDSVTKKMVENPIYIVSVIRRLPDGRWILSRKIFFSRDDLRVRKQVLYDADGNIATVATYNNFKGFDGEEFPGLIQIERPQEEYSIQLGLVKARLNQPISDDQFELQQPQGSKLEVLDGVDNPDAPKAGAVMRSANQAK